jgi:hypothetical protein
MTNTFEAERAIIKKLDKNPGFTDIAAAFPPFPARPLGTLDYGLESETPILRQMADLTKDFRNKSWQRPRTTSNW